MRDMIRVKVWVPGDKLHFHRESFEIRVDSGVLYGKIYYPDRVRSGTLLPCVCWLEPDDDALEFVVSKGWVRRTIATHFCGSPDQTIRAFCLSGLVIISAHYF